MPMASGYQLITPDIVHLLLVEWLTLSIVISLWPRGRVWLVCLEYEHFKTSFQCWETSFIVVHSQLQSCCRGIIYKCGKIVKIQTQKYFRLGMCSVFLDFLRFSLFTNVWLIPCCTSDIYYSRHQRQECMFSFRVAHLLDFFPTVVNFLLLNVKSFCIITLIFYMQ